MLPLLPLLALLAARPPTGTSAGEAADGAAPLVVLESERGVEAPPLPACLLQGLPVADSPAKWHPGAAANASATSCNPFAGVPVVESPAEHLYNVPAAMGGHGFHRGAVPPVLTSAIGNGTAPLAARPGRLPEKYAMAACTSKYRSAHFAALASGGAAEADQMRELGGALAGKHLLMLGDSVMRQLAMVLMCSLRFAGLEPSKIAVSADASLSATYPNGMMISRWSMEMVKGIYRTNLDDVLSVADVALVNLGRHYSYGDRSNGRYLAQAKIVTSAMARVLGARGLVLETLPAHFPTPSGDMTDPRGAKKLQAIRARARRRGTYTCKMFHDAAGSGWQNEAMHGAAAEDGVAVVALSHLFNKRQDAHVGFRRRTGRMDCLHWCYTQSLFQPVVATLAKAVRAALACPAEPRVYRFVDQWEALERIVRREAEKY